MDGLLIVDKPHGWTSHDVVDFIRKTFRLEKVGHAGTLDPMATGVLIILIGSFTKLAQKLVNSEKEYEGVLRLGIETDTADLDGKVITQSQVPQFSMPDIKKVFDEFIGDIEQVPPMVSAVRFKGKRLYELARKGLTVSRPSRKISIRNLEILKIDIPDVWFRLVCSKGTYVRVFCEDAGKRLGCGGCTSKIRRIRCGVYTVDKAITVEKLKHIQPDQLEAFLEKPTF